MASTYLKPYALARVFTYVWCRLSIQNLDRVPANNVTSKLTRPLVHSGVVDINRNPIANTTEVDLRDLFH